jgi:hypothetical protein
MPKKPSIPRELVVKLKESQDGYYEFDTSETGPFRLPLLGKLESVDFDKSLGQVILRFRDYGEGKAYQIPLRARILPELIDMISTLENVHGKELREQDAKLVNNSGTEH